jgi:hypothetical protein
MMKTSEDIMAKPDVSLIILGVLKGYFEDAESCMENVKLLCRKISADMLQASSRYPKDFVQIVSVAAALYIELQKDLDQETALSLVTAAFLPVGLAMQLGNFRYVEERHTFDNLIRYQQRTNKLGPTRLNQMEIITQNDNIYEFHVHNCLFKDAFTELEMPELTKVMCAIDNVIFNVYMPDQVHFYRNGAANTIAEGKQYCTFLCEHKPL